MDAEKYLVSCIKKTSTGTNFTQLGTEIFRFSKAKSMLNFPPTNERSSRKGTLCYLPDCACS